MNKFVITLICLVVSSFILNAQGTSSKISQTLQKSKTLHTSDLWHVIETKGEDKSVLNLFAAEYSEFNIPSKLIGLQFELYIETTLPAESSSKLSNKFYSYIDENEYPEAILALNNLISDLNNRVKDEKDGEAFYITQDGIKIGYRLSPESEIAYIELNSLSSPKRAEFSNPLKFLQEINNVMDIVSKKLYLPENAEKLKNAKKQKQQEEVKDVIIDDI